MRFRILGPLEVWDDGQRLPIDRPQQRALLAMLLLNANRVVSTEQLVEDLWADQPPPTARGLLQGCVARLRRSLPGRRDGDARQPLLTRPPSYLLEVRPVELDLDRFEEFVAAANPAGTAAKEHSRDALERSAALLSEALAPVARPGTRRHRAGRLSGAGHAAGRAPADRTGTADRRRAPAGPPRKPDRSAAVARPGTSRCGNDCGRSSCWRCTAGTGRRRPSRPITNCAAA
jgi:hypothetical protein